MYDLTDFFYIPVDHENFVVSELTLALGEAFKSRHLRLQHESTKNSVMEVLRHGYKILHQAYL